MSCREFNDFKSCVEAVGGYGNLYAMLCFLNNNDCLTFDEDKLDEEFDVLNTDEAYDVLNIFEIELTSDEQLDFDEFLKDVEFTEPYFKGKVAQYIVQNILPYRQEYQKEE